MSFRTMLRGVLAALFRDLGVTVLAPPGTATGETFSMPCRRAGSDPLSLNGAASLVLGPANSGVMTYRPRYNWNPATFQVVETPSDVWGACGAVLSAAEQHAQRFGHRRHRPRSQRLVRPGPRRHP